MPGRFLFMDWFYICLAGFNLHPIHQRDDMKYLTAQGCVVLKMVLIRCSLLRFAWWHIRTAFSNSYIIVPSGSVKRIST